MSRALKVVMGGCLVVTLLFPFMPAIAAEKEPRFTRTTVDVRIPGVTLINQDGEAVDFGAVLQSDKPVFVDFIFATCTTICPILSAGYSSLQRKLGDERDQVRLISITIDPEHDGPEELTEYLQRYRAQSGWDFLTGTREDIDLVMRGFDAFVPDKMSHRPLIFIRSADSGEWVRIYGFAGSADLLNELRLASVRTTPEGVAQ